ncbi:hypothetical protein LIA77_00248 [Sarocladium implicatum]|nr:hypothetical protein LIA77_00248 [Sarocladium implicatum]
MSAPTMKLSMEALSDRWRRPKFRPQCTHPTMSRLYGSEFLCDHCRRPGEFGWIYRCSHDREEVIDFALSQGYPSTFDQLGKDLAARMKVRKRSRAARESSLSFFDEISSEQMSSYNPDQIATILKQRENVSLAAQNTIFAIIDNLQVHSVIAAEDSPKKASPNNHRFQIAWNSQRSRDTAAWTELLDSECEYQICAYCRPGAADRTFLSLNAVADDEIMPCAATGFGFHVMGERPIIDAVIMRNIGLRQDRSLVSTMVTAADEYSLTNSDLFDVFHRQPSYAHGKEDWDKDESEMEATWPSLPTDAQEPKSRLKHSPRYENLAIYSQYCATEPKVATAKNPWTPPPSPGPGHFSDAMAPIGDVAFSLGDESSERVSKGEAEGTRPPI